jgi:CRISPR-associated endonuclease Csn1
MRGKMRYRLGLDLGTNSIGWAMIRLDVSGAPCAVIRAGVRIFSDGRNPKSGASLAVDRRLARSMRRRRDRLLKRKARMMRMLVDYRFFPSDNNECKRLEQTNPYELRAKGLDHPLTPAEFARAVFHINQRRGFKSNRKTDKKEATGSALKDAIKGVRSALEGGGARTVGEFLYQRMLSGEPVRARYRESRTQNAEGKTRILKSYDLYIDRAMVEAEFDALWASQKRFNAQQYNDKAYTDIKDTLLFQRPLKPVKPGRCTLLPDEERAPLALPSVQRFRMLQEVNNLRVTSADLTDRLLTKSERDLVIEALESNAKRTFIQIRRLLQLPASTSFNLEDEKRPELKGNATAASLRREGLFGEAWDRLTRSQQDEIVERLITEESEAKLIDWLKLGFGFDDERAESIASAGMPEGFGNLSRKALTRLLPHLESDVITYDKAVQAAGFEHHSQLSAAVTGEVLDSLPYYGRVLQRHVGFGSGDPKDPEEKQFGKIANPTVHIGLNQTRLIINTLIKKYGHPAEVIVELARDLKQSKAHKDEEQKRQAENQRRNDRHRETIAEILGVSTHQVRREDIQKVVLWEELHRDPLERRCPYSGEMISIQQLLSASIEIEHILPFSQTLDDSLNNKTVSLRSANRIKGNQTPYEAFGKHNVQGFDYAAILTRAASMPKGKAYRFAPDGMQRWLKEDQGFLARALNDTRYLSRIAREYVSLICPDETRVIPGQLTAMLRAKFGLNAVLGHEGEKNREDHRHHAVDACVVAVTDRKLLQRFASASASARARQLDRLVEDMPLPWASYREHVARAVHAIKVSHRPDHGFEGAMHNDTAYGLGESGQVHHRVDVNGKRELRLETIRVIPMNKTTNLNRHGTSVDGKPKAYKGYKGDSNYCMDIIQDPKGKWIGKVVSTFEAYQLAKVFGVKAVITGSGVSDVEKAVARIRINDTLTILDGDEYVLLRIATLSSSGTVSLIQLHEANVDARVRRKELSYIYKTAGSLQKAKAKPVTVDCIGNVSS